MARVFLLVFAVACKSATDVPFDPYVPPIPRAMVVGMAPDDGATDVDRETDVSIELDAPFPADARLVVERAGVAVPGSTVVDGNRLVWLPDERLALRSELTVTLASTEMADGSVLVEPVTWSFTTADGTWGAPVALPQAPSDWARLVDVDVDDAGNAWATWVSSGWSWSASFRPAGGAWEAPTELRGPSAGAAATWAPQLMVGLDGTAHAVRREAGGLHVARRNPGGAWEVLEPLATDTYEYDAAVDDEGCVAVVWSTPTALNARVHGPAGWGPVQSFPAFDAVGRIAPLGAGEWMVAWVEPDGGTARFATYEGGAWSASMPLGVGWPLALVGRADGVVSMLFSHETTGAVRDHTWDNGTWTTFDTGLPTGWLERSESGRVVVAVGSGFAWFKTDDWSAPTDVGLDIGAGRYRAVPDDAGNAVLLSDDATSGWLVRHHPGEGWQPAELAFQGATDSSIDVSGAGRAIAAWTVEGDVMIRDFD